jgi:IS1 family transposase
MRPWSYVGKKQRKVLPTDSMEKGDQYVFLALEGSHKAILSYAIGKRDMETTCIFMSDLRQRIINQPVINSDAFTAYPEAVERYFGHGVRYGQIVKSYAGEPPKDAARRYSPGYVVGVETRVVTGRPGHISTSYIERQNLSLRMAQRRFTRLTNGFSKKLRNHKAAVALYVAHYNLCRVHETLRITPAMALGITDHVWSVAELVQAADTGSADYRSPALRPLPCNPRRAVLRWPVDCPNSDSTVISCCAITAKEFRKGC